MKRASLSFLILFSVLLIPLSLAQVDIDVQSRYYCALSPSELDVKVTNNLNESDTFLMTFGGDNRNWAYVKRSYVKLESGESKTLSFLIIPPKDIESGKYFLDIHFKGLETGWKETQEVCLTILENYNAKIDKTSVSKDAYDPGEDVTTTVGVANIGAKDFDKIKVSTVLSKGGSIIEEKSKGFALKADARNEVEFKFEMGKFAKPGEYAFTYKLEGVGKVFDEEGETFRVKELEEFDTSRDKSWTPVASLESVKITNLGNIRATKTVEIGVPKFWSFLVTTEKRPELKSSADRIIYQWDITLDPKESEEISLQINYWPLILFFIALVYVGFILFLRVRRLKVVKRVVSKREEKNEYTIAIDIKNNSRETIKNVVVKDSIPSIGKIIKRSINVKPKIKELKTKTNMEWDLGDLKRGDERLITYRIKTIVEALDSFKLPAIEVEAKDGKKIKKFSTELKIYKNKKE